MKWVYLGLGIVGTLTPMGVLYALNFDRRIPGLLVDMGLLFHSAGLSILFIPLGMGAGVVLAGIIHFAWNRRPGRTGFHGRWTTPGSPTSAGPE